MRSLTDGVAWIRGGWKSDKLATTIPGIGSGVTVGDPYGFQCSAWSVGYSIFLGLPLNSGVVPNAIDLWNHPQPGWEHTNAPAPGYVFVAHAVINGFDYGHTGVVDHLVPGGFYSWDQDWVNWSLEHGSPPALVYHPLSYPVGYLRPAQLTQAQGEDMFKGRTAAQWAEIATKNQVALDNATAALKNAQSTGIFKGRTAPQWAEVATKNQVALDQANAKLEQLQQQPVPSGVDQATKDQIAQNTANSGKILSAVTAIAKWLHIPGF